MKEDISHTKKIPVVIYDLSPGNHLMVYPISDGYHCSGKIADVALHEDAKTMEEIYSSIVKKLDSARINYLNNAGIIEGISLRIKENIQSEENPLEKLTRDLGGKIRQRR